MTRLPLLARLALTGILFLSGTGAQTALAHLPAPAVSLAQAGDLYALTGRGELWRVSEPPVRVATGLSPEAPLGSCNGQILAVTRSGGLWWGGPTRVSGLSTSAGLTCSADGTALTISRNGEVLRVDRGGQIVRSAALNVLPDARPRLADLRGDVQPLLMVLAQPTRRYVHGILGDDLEAASLLALNPKTLKVEARLDLPAPFVFEDLEARPMRVDSRDVVALVRSSSTGGAALVVGLEGQDLSVLTAGPDFGQPHRWLAPVTDGANLYAVHTPHIGGTLYQYTWTGKVLKASPVPGIPQVSNHHIGTRFILGGVWKGEVWVGTQDGSQVLHTAGLPKRSSAPSTPLLRAGDAANLGLQDGTVLKLP